MCSKRCSPAGPATSLLGAVAFGWRCQPAKRFWWCDLTPNGTGRTFHKPCSETSEHPACRRLQTKELVLLLRGVHIADGSVSARHGCSRNVVRRVAAARFRQVTV